MGFIENSSESSNNDEPFVWVQGPVTDTTKQALEVVGTGLTSDAPYDLIATHIDQSENSCLAGHVGHSAKSLRLLLQNKLADDIRFSRGKLASWLAMTTLNTLPASTLAHTILANIPFSSPEWKNSIKKLKKLKQQELAVIMNRMS